MHVTTISATYERKHNLGNYNSANIGLTLWAQLEEGDDEAACAIALRNMARNHVMAELSRLDRRLEAKVQDLFMGLPVEVRSQLADTPPNLKGPLSWDEVAHAYNTLNPGGRRAKTLEMNVVFDWVARQPGYVVVDDSLYKEINNAN